MKNLVLSLATLLLFSCGEKSKNSRPAHEEERIGVLTKSECKRAEEVRGSNGIYHWIQAGAGDLQRIMLHMDTKTIDYDEVTQEAPIQNSVPFIQKQSSLYFKTTSKSLKLKFTPNRFGMIENDIRGKEYVVGLLSYDDGSGYSIPFLCPQYE